VWGDLEDEIMKYIATLLLTALTGCAIVPQTVITFNKTKDGFAIHSPKDIELVGTEISITTNGDIYVRIDSYKAHNNIEAIQAVAEGNAAARMSLEKNGAELLGTLIGAAK